MKLSTALGIALLFAISGGAQEITSPKIIRSIYALNMSPSGRWISGGLGEVVVYDLENDKMYNYPDCKSAQGMSLTDSGIVIGSSNGRTVIMKNGETTVPQTSEDVRSFYLTSITPDGKHVCGSINSKDVAGLFTGEMDEEGNLLNIEGLPRPELDLFNCEPQFVNALKISDDGQTIAGFVQDWKGGYAYPIVWTKDDSDEWGYSLPSKSSFNPSDTEIPVNPWLDEPYYPEVTDFMRPDVRQKYEEAKEDAFMGYGDLPDPFDYLSKSELEQYFAAEDNYNEWYYSHLDAMRDYQKIYFGILSESVNFDLNTIAIHPNGEFIALEGFWYDDHQEITGVYVMNLKTEEDIKYPTSLEVILPLQILSDGTIVSSQPISAEPNTYLILSGTDEVISVRDYYMATNPSYAAWMNEFIPESSGQMFFNSDMSVSVGSLYPFDCDYEKIIDDFDVFAYVFGYENINPEAGIGNLTDSDSSEIYDVYNLTGVKILSTKEKSDFQHLKKGIYIINGKKVVI